MFHFLHNRYFVRFLYKGVTSSPSIPMSFLVTPLLTCHVVPPLNQTITGLRFGKSVSDVKPYNGPNYDTHIHTRAYTHKTRPSIEIIGLTPVKWFLHKYLYTFRITFDIYIYINIEIYVIINIKIYVIFHSIITD